MKTFLAQAGWADARQDPLAGDASSRRYTRLQKGTARAILMQDDTGDVALFARLARHLCSHGLSAPRIIAEDAKAGLLLLEDLGDGLVARLATDAQSERDLYLAATDALIALHCAPLPDGLPVASAQTLAQMTDLAFVHYTQDAAAGAEVVDALLPVLQAHAMPADVMILRDFHAENILDLPDRKGAARMGLLDFQDALQGHRAYDLASLLRDVRRDVLPQTAQACIAHYGVETGADTDAFDASLAVLGVQRNLRILGIFARLAQQGKPHYLSFLPRTWRYLQADLRHPVLAGLRPALASLPAPTPDFIERLRAQCPTP